LALKYRTPVMLLTDGYLATSSEPWKLPDVADLPDLSVRFATETNHVDDAGEPQFWPYLRDPETLARPWAVPGTAGLEHRIGGIEKEEGTGNISYDPANHQLMVETRAAKVAGIARDIPHAEVDGPDDADVLVVGWGSTWGAICGAVDRARDAGKKVARVHLMHLNPFPDNLGEILARYDAVLVPELNQGQLSRLLRAEYLVDARAVTKTTGRPFTAGELEAAIMEACDR
jgi:2-oxoglutarate ferredoxin oxidoreductase subunit alpha